MGRQKVNELAMELDEVFIKFRGNQWLLKEAILQMIDRENIITSNRIRARHGEAEVVPESKRYKQRSASWIIDVPKSWISLTGKE